MSILHLTHTDVRTDSRILKELTCLVKLGYDVTGVGIEFDEGSIKSDSNEILNLITLMIHSNSLRKNKYIPRPIVHLCIFVELFLKMFYQVRFYKPKIVHCHDTFVLPLGVLSKLLYGSKLVYDAHELESKKAGLSKLSSFATLTLEKMCWRYVDALIVVSNSIEKWYHKNFKAIKSEVILNSPTFKTGYELKRNNYLRSKFSIPNNEKVFVYVGLFGAERFIRELIDVFSDDDVKSHIVFIGFGDLLEEISNAAMNTVNVHYHPAVKHDELLSVISSADLGLCLIPNASLSDYYCLPNKLFEYIFSHIPVLCSDMPEISRLILENGFGIVCDLNVSSVLAAVKKIENDEENLLINPALLHDYSWEMQEFKLKRLYSEL